MLLVCSVQICGVWAGLGDHDGVMLLDSHSISTDTRHLVDFCFVCVVIVVLELACSLTVRE